MEILSAFPETEAMEAAIRFINSTASHIFLTGKAGTGKTTFLKSLTTRTHKSFAVVAPTGIAALNAGGVTIHSQFLFPFGMYLPDRNASTQLSDSGNWFSSNTLAKKHPLNSLRKQVLRSIDLLVIDEVSMLRPDLLDAIDYRLKSVRGNFSQGFGGVQLLLIGDLFQLPPVVRREEEEKLRQYYSSSWFFESLALRQDGFVYIELDKIFRQRDDIFIALLNNLRNNQPTSHDIDELNRHYVPSDEIERMDEVITLTTHNYKADELNKSALEKLDGPRQTFEATIEGDFPESMYPVLPALELKVGAQIMFTKNDPDGAYFNGKLAVVKSISPGRIEVSLAGTHESYVLKKETWQNKKYTMNASTQDLDDEVIGTFEQYPVKLAWAITVHKSQGLTFDRAIIDVGQAFADGQVYVALSRLRSLGGLILRTRIDPRVVSTDNRVVSFTSEKNKPDQLPQMIKDRRLEFIHRLLTKTFDFDFLRKEIAFVRRNDFPSGSLGEESMKPVLEQVSNLLLNESENTEKFRRQLIQLLESSAHEQLLERLKKGSDYYKNFLNQIVKTLLQHLEEMKQHRRVKGYVNNLTDLDQLFAKKLEEIDKTLLLTDSILNDKDQFNFENLKEQRALERAKMLDEIRSHLKIPARKPAKSKGKGKKKKGEPSTYEITVALLDGGLSVEAIAKERGLVIGTIEGHLAAAVEAGRVSIHKFMTEEQVDIITETLKKMPEGFTSKDLFAKLNGKFGYGKLRAVMNYTGIKSSRTQEP